MLDTIVQALSSVLAAFIGALFAIIVFRGEKRSDTAREQLDKVYVKAFRLIEPVMYQKILRADCDKLVQQLSEIATEGGILTDPQLTATLDYYKSAPSGDKDDYPNFKYHFLNRTPCYLTYWYEICSHIDQNYDILCRKAFLPVRKLGYRLDRNQYLNRFIWTINLLRFSWRPILLFFAVVFVTLLQLLVKSK